MSISLSAAVSSPRPSLRRRGFSEEYLPIRLGEKGRHIRVETLQAGAGVITLRGPLQSEHCIQGFRKIFGAGRFEQRGQHGLERDLLPRGLLETHIDRVRIRRLKLIVQHRRHGIQSSGAELVADRASKSGGNPVPSAGACEARAGRLSKYTSDVEAAPEHKKKVPRRRR